MKSSTATELELKLKAAEINMHHRISRMEVMLNKSTQMFAEKIVREELKDKFIGGEKINHFEWTYERIYKPRECFVGIQRH